MDESPFSNLESKVLNHFPLSAGIKVVVIEGEIKPGDDVKFHNDDDHRAHDFHVHPPDVEKEFDR